MLTIQMMMCSQPMRIYLSTALAVIIHSTPFDVDKKKGEVFAENEL